MSWNWVKAYPVFVYTTFIDHNVFNVKIVLGTKGNQNAGNTGPNAKPWFQYKSTEYAAKRDVVTKALRITSRLMKSRRLI